jgi:type III secretion protein T
MDELVMMNKALTNFAYVMPRLAGAFVILPLFTNDIVPAMIRNVVIAAMSLVVFPMVASTIDAEAIGAVRLPVMLAKEVFIGAVLGFCFSVVFWAIEMAGQIIDTKVGATTAQINDPLAGHQTTLTGAFLGRFASWLFVASGGLLIFLDLVLTSYAVWPVHKSLPSLSVAGQEFVIARAQQMLLFALMLSAPALILMTMVDLGMGVMNKFAQQLNVFQLSQPVKALIAIWMLLAMLNTIVTYTQDHLDSLRGLARQLSQMLT